MKITIRLFSSLERYAPETGSTMDIEPGLTVSRLIQNLGMQEHMAGIILINGHRVSLDAYLKEGDHLIIFPSMEGG